MAFAGILEKVGGTGRFQVLHVTLLCTPILMMASYNLLQNFVANVPPHFCRAPKNSSVSHLGPQEALLLTVPLDSEGKPSKCQRYSTPQWHLLARNNTPTETGGVVSSTLDPLSTELQGCEEGWEYNMNEMSSTIISEWDLVCDSRSLKQMGQSIYMGGVLVGAVVFGGLADKFGRRILLMLSYLLMAVSGTCAAFSPSFQLFCFFRFLCGMGLSGQALNSLSLILEWIPTHVRTVVGTGAGYFYTVGQLILAGMAYFIRDWRWLTLAVSIPYFIAFLYSWWLLESARWLVLNGKSEQAVKNLRYVALFNGRRAEGDKINVEVLQESMKKEISCSQGTYSALDLLRTPAMRTITISLCVVWFTTSFAYYGLSMDLQKFGVDIYLIQVIFGAVDIPAKVIMTVSMSKIGRRVSQSAAIILSGIMILANLLVPYEKQVLRTTLAVLGKGCSAASFNCCYLYTGELFPTIIRQNGMGWVSMMARLGAMVAPLILILGDVVSWLPGLIYGGIPILAGGIALFLPETLGMPLPDTIQDAEERSLAQKSSKSLKKGDIVLKEANNSLLKETI
ncbi:solute carrier family 22 member 6-like isoform X1 [Conger conger]|uniref:solute carrier family 22 member 6-like isoform X1 n=1 Tax=Conger conger TaxID=82655 RepID=UPI002A5A0889|nr:solute carrier family 22 member 6-like isoform X1 [Conger conger]